MTPASHQYRIDPLPPSPPAHIYRFTRQDLRIISALLPGWYGPERTRQSATPEAVFTGLAGELAVCRFFDLPTEFIRRDPREREHSFVFFTQEPNEGVPTIKTVSVRTSAKRNSMAAEERGPGSYSDVYIAVRLYQEAQNQYAAYITGYLSGNGVARRPKRPGMNGATAFHVIPLGMLQPLSDTLDLR